MRALAEFVMRSRLHATGTSVVAAALPYLGWLSAVIVALTTLRHGVFSGSLVVLWTSLPGIAAWWLTGDPSLMIIMTGTFLMATLLRRTLSWELVLVAAVIFSVPGTLLFQYVASDILDEVAALYVAYLAANTSLVVEPEQVRTLFLGFVALGQSGAMILLLMIARWCQSALYNPQGFRKEFHALRLSPVVSAGLVFGLLICYLFSGQLGQWLPLLSLPLLFAAIALVHWVIALKGLSGFWLVGLYASLILLSQFVYPLLASLALVDSWLNIRNRMEIAKKD